MMKKIILILTLLIIVGILAGCTDTGKAWYKPPKMPSLPPPTPVPVPTPQPAPAPVSTTDFTPVYRCWWVQHWSGGPSVVNHFLSTDSTCGGGVNRVDGLVGYLYKTQKPNTVAVTQCYRQTRHDSHTYSDHFAVHGTACPANTQFNGILGYALTTENADTKKIYRCWNYPDHISDGRFDHMVSAAIGCEGYTNEHVIFNFFKNPKITSPPLPSPPAPKPPLTPPVPAPATDFTPVYRCWWVQHWSGGPSVVNHFLSTDSTCGGGVNRVDGLVGYLYKTQKPNTVAVTQCYRQTRHDSHTYSDHFAVRGTACPANTRFNGILGYALTTENADTKKIYRCWNYPDHISGGRFDHMVSAQVGCEGYTNEHVIFNFFKNPKVTAPAVSPPKVSVNAAIIVNDVAPATDVIIATDINIILNRRSNFNVNIGTTKLDSEIKLSELSKYNIIARVLFGDVNLFVKNLNDANTAILTTDLIVDLRKRNIIVSAPKQIDSITVRDLAEIPQS